MFHFTRTLREILKLVGQETNEVRVKINFTLNFIIQMTGRGGCDRESLKMDLEYTFRNDVTNENLNQIDLGRFSRWREGPSETNDVFG